MKEESKAEEEEESAEKPQPQPSKKEKKKGKKEEAKQSEEEVFIRQQVESSEEEALRTIPTQPAEPNENQGSPEKKELGYETIKRVFQQEGIDSVLRVDASILLDSDLKTGMEKDVERVV